MNILEKIKDTLPLGETWDQFEAILSLPDNQFDAIYPEFKKSVENLFSTQGFQNQILDQVQNMPAGLNIEEEKKDFKDFIKTIEEDNSISNNKKNFLIMFLEESVLSAYEMYSLPRNRVEVKIEKLVPDAIIPTYAHPSDAGCDVCAVEGSTLNQGETKIIKTGLKVAIPVGYEIQVRPRSGLSLKTNLRVANAPGTIDSSYRGELGIVMTNIGTEPITINKGDKVAQLIIAASPMIKWVEGPVDENTDRGTGGYGSTDSQ